MNTVAAILDRLHALLTFKFTKKSEYAITYKVINKKKSQRKKNIFVYYDNII